MALGTAFTGVYARLVPNGYTPLRQLYVNGAATGSNNGLSPTNAWTSFASALGTAQAGDEVLVYPGTYTASPTFNWNPPNARAGTAANPIQFKAQDPLNKPILRGAASDARTMNIQKTGTTQVPNFTLFKDLIFEKHASATTPNYKMVEVWHSSGTPLERVEFDGCHFRDGRTQGLFIRFGTLRVQVWNCELYDSGANDLVGQGHNSYIMGTEHVIAQNIFRDAPNGFAFQCWTEEEIQDCLVVNNIGNNAGDGSGFGFGGEGGGTIGAVDGNRVYNNIFTNNQDSAIVAYNDGLNSCTGNTATNNLAFGNGASPPFYTDNNVLATNSAALNAANFTGNPLYLNEPGNDFHITSLASPAHTNLGVEAYTPVLDKDGLPRSVADLGPYRIATGGAPPGGGKRRGTTLGVR